MFSDGKDTQGNSALDIQKYLKEQKTINFTIHSFGFGESHDDSVLTSLSDIKNGNFYYIKDQKFIDQCFISCLSYLLSTIVVKAKLKIFFKEKIDVQKIYNK